MVWTNTQLGPSGSPRPDVFTVDKSYARFACDAYEIKVSVSDLRRDTTSGKWQSYRKFAHRVWFAFERGLVPLADIPRECGVILRGEGGTWRAARKPVSQVLDTMPRDAWLKLLIESYPTDAFGHRKAPRIANDWAVQQIAREKLGEKLAELFSARLSAEKQYEFRTKELRDAAGKIAAEIAEQRKYAEQQAAERDRRLTEAQTELASSLGLPADAGISDLTRRINDFRWALQRGAGLDNAIANLQKLRNLIRLQVGEEVEA
jgi:hypothetical protein